jgi:hypothetical protein
LWRRFGGALGQQTGEQHDEHANSSNSLISRLPSWLRQTFHLHPAW